MSSLTKKENPLIISLNKLCVIIQRVIIDNSEPSIILLYANVTARTLSYIKCNVLHLSCISWMFTGMLNRRLIQQEHSRQRFRILGSILHSSSPDLLSLRRIRQRSSRARGFSPTSYSHFACRSFMESSMDLITMSP